MTVSLSGGLPGLSPHGLQAQAGLGTEGLSRLKSAIAIGQHTRLIQIDTPLPEGTLVVERFRLDEAVQADEPLWAELDCLSTNAHLQLKALMGARVSLRLKLADGTWRHWHGHVVQAGQLGSDGGLGAYRLVVAAFTHWLKHRRDTRIFQDASSADIIDEVLSAYPQASFRLDLADPGPIHEITTQFRETDWAFATRLMAREGWSWRVDHDAKQHTLVVFDQQAQRRDLGPLRFGRADLREGPGGGWQQAIAQAFGLEQGGAQDTITAWSVGRQIGPNIVSLGAWDERQLVGVSGNASADAPSAVPALEHYQGHGVRRFADGRVGTAQPASTKVATDRAQALMDAQELRQYLVSAQSAVRALSPGDIFQITEHSLYGLGSDNGFCALGITHEAANNLGHQAAQILQRTDIEQGSYRNRFRARPAAVRIVPMPPQTPTAPGPQTAIVVAAENEPLTTDRDGRIRIQFGWQRGVSPLPGALQAPRTPGGANTGHAPGNAQSGSWVRVAQASAGANWGAVFIPRAGSEVLVDFIDGDIDRPLVLGQLHNGAHDLPWPAGADSGANHPGTLSGWHHQSLDGQGVNQWLVDDSHGQLRMRLLNYGVDTGHSELTLGHIIQQSAQGGSGHAQRGQWLGEGFYGYTDGWAVVRAGEGLLMSTTARNARGASVNSTQMDAQEAVAQLKAARQLGLALSQSARQQGAQGLASHDANQAMQRHTDAMDPAALGRYEGSVNGQLALKAEGRTLTEPVERFAKPLLHLDTPASAMWVTPSSISLFSGQDTNLCMQGDAHLTSAHTLSSVSGQTTSLYTHAGGIKAITANADLSLRAHTDDLQIWSDKDLTVQSVSDEIHIQASNSITLTAGQSQIVISGGDITFTCPGTFTVKAASHAWEGPGRGAGHVLEMPEGRAHLPVQASSLMAVEPEKYSQRILVVDPVSGEHQSTRYALFKNASVLTRGRTDGGGLSDRHVADQSADIEVLVGASGPWTVEYHDGLDRLPLAYTDEDYLAIHRGNES